MKPLPNLPELERIHGISWHDLVDLEPKFAELLWEASGAGASCRNRPEMDSVFAPIRNALAEIIGFARRHHWHPILGSLGSYEVAYWKLYGAVAGSMPTSAGGAEEAVQRHRRGTVARNYRNDSAATAMAGAR